MWDVFALSVAVMAAFSFVPGAIALRALGVDRVLSVACAPACAVFAATIATLAFRAAGMACSWEALACSLAACAVVCAAAGAIARRAHSGAHGGFARLMRCEASKARRPFDRMRCARGAFALAVGLAAGALVFAVNLGDPSVYSQEYDNIHHLGQIRAYAETGLWSPFDGTLYPGDAAAYDPLPSVGFYPSAWHLLAVVAVDALGASVPVAANAATFLFGFIVYPLAMWAFLEKIFPERPAAVVLGSCAAVAFGAFPYGLITFGPLYPNLASFALVPAVGACFASLFDRGCALSSRVGLAVLFCVGLGALVFAQPNGVFSLGVLMLFFCAQQAACAGGAWWRERHAGVSTIDRRKLAMVKWAFAVGFLVFAAIVWIAMFLMPFMRSVVTHMWPSFLTVPQAVISVLLVAYGQFAPSIVLALLVVIGAVYTLYRRQYVWITCSYVFACGIYFVCAVSNGWVKSLTSGFWYTDSNRLAATLVLIGVPLAALGLYAVCRGVRTGLGALARRMGTGGLYPRASLWVTAFAFAALAFCPNFDYAWNGPVITQMGSVETAIAVQSDMDGGSKTYDASEREFVRRAKEVLPEGSVVINEPNDGSAFAYCVDGANVAFRYLREFDTPDERESSRIVRLELVNAASDDRVAAAVHDLGAGYLLLLDQGNPDATRLFTYNPQEWEGVEAVTDETPGFTVLLAQGDMRLYRIDV